MCQICSIPFKVIVLFLTIIEIYQLLHILYTKIILSLDDLQPVGGGDDAAPPLPARPGAKPMAVRSPPPPPVSNGHDVRFFFHSLLRMTCFHLVQ